MSNKDQKIADVFDFERPPMPTAILPPAPTKEDIKTVQKLVTPHPWQDVRKSVGIEEILKLQTAFSVGATDEQAAGYAGIHRDTLYKHMAKNPEFKDWVETLKEKPILKAKNTIVQHLNDPAVAFRYLERRSRKEFGVAAPDKEAEKEEVMVIYTPKKNPTRKENKQIEKENKKKNVSTEEHLETT